MKLKVLKENALKAYESADEKGKKLLVDLFPGQLVPISIRERIDRGDVLTFEDILADQNISEEEWVKKTALDTKDESAFKAAKLISKAINVTPLTDSESWYWPTFNRSASGFSHSSCVNWFTHSFVGARLCGFRTSSDAMYAGKTFNEIYKPLL